MKNKIEECNIQIGQLGYLSEESIEIIGYIKNYQVSRICVPVPQMFSDGLLIVSCIIYTQYLCKIVM